MICDFVESYKYKGGAKDCAHKKLYLKTLESYFNDLIQYRSGYLTLSEVYRNLDHDSGDTLENLQYGWTKEDLPFKFEMLYEGKFVLKYRLAPRQLLKLIDQDE